MSGFFGPQQIDVDPTAEAFRPSRDALGQFLMQRLLQGVAPSRSPFGGLQSPVQQLFPGSFLNPAEGSRGFGSGGGGGAGGGTDEDRPPNEFQPTDDVPGAGFGDVFDQRGPFGAAPLGQAQGPFQAPETDGVISSGSRLDQAFQPQFNQSNLTERAGLPGDFGGGGGFDPGSPGFGQDPGRDPFNLQQFGGPFSAPLTGGQLDALSGFRQLFDPSRIISNQGISEALELGLSGDPAFNPNQGSSFDQVVKPFRVSSSTDPFFEQLFGTRRDLPTSILQGLRGETGATGATGATGVQGFTGVEGLRGRAGAAGERGLQGIEGLMGLAGARGDIGERGLTGLTGDVGRMGIAGTIGERGLTGLQGLTGARGELGFQGLTGLTGAQGIQGEQGTQGLTEISARDLLRFNPQFLATGGQIDEHVDTIVGEAGPELIPAGTNQVVPLQQFNPELLQVEQAAGAVPAPLTSVGSQVALAPAPLPAATLQQQAPTPGAPIPGEVQAQAAPGPAPGPSFDDFITPILGKFQESFQEALGAPRFDLTETFGLGEDVFRSDLDRQLAQIKEESSRFGLNPGSSDRGDRLLRTAGTEIGRFRLGQQDLARQSFESAENRRLGAVSQGPQVGAFLNTPFSNQLQALPFQLQREQQEIENFFRSQEGAAARRQQTLGMLPQFSNLPFQQAQGLFDIEGQARGAADQDIMRRLQEFQRTQGGGLDQILSAISGTPLQNTAFGPSGFGQATDLIAAIGSFFGGGG